MTDGFSMTRIDGFLTKSYKPGLRVYYSSKDVLFQRGGRHIEAVLERLVMKNLEHHCCRP